METVIDWLKIKGPGKSGGAWIAEWSSHSTTMNIGTLRPGPWGRSLYFLAQAQHLRSENFQKKRSKKEAERTIINTIIC